MDVVSLNNGRTRIRINKKEIFAVFNIGLIMSHLIPLFITFLALGISVPSPVFANPTNTSAMPSIGGNVSLGSEVSYYTFDDNTFDIEGSKHLIGFNPLAVDDEVSYWDLDEDLDDAGSHGNDLSDGGTITYTTGIWEEAGSFDGSSDNLHLEDVSDYGSDTEGTICAWANLPTDDNGVHMLWSWVDDSISENGRIELYYNMGDDSMNYVHKTDNVNNAWVRLVNSADGCVGNWCNWCIRNNSTTTTMFKNGVELNGQIKTGDDLTKWLKNGITDASDKIDDFNIGMRDSNHYFDGLLDEVRIWDSALSDEAIRTIYTGSSDYVTGQYENAIDFDGSTEYIYTTDLDELSDDTEGTICSWNNINSDDGNENVVWAFVDDSDSGNGRIHFQYHFASDQFAYANKIDGSDNAWVLSSTDSTDDCVGNLCHTCLRVNNSRVGIFINGVENVVTHNVGTLNWLKAGITDATNKIDKFSIGARDNDNYFDGSVDDVKIFDIALSDNEILGLYEGIINFEPVIIFDNSTSFHKQGEVFTKTFCAYDDNDDLVSQQLVIDGPPTPNGCYWDGEEVICIDSPYPPINVSEYNMDQDENGCSEIEFNDSDFTNLGHYYIVKDYYDPSVAMNSSLFTSPIYEFNSTYNETILSSDLNNPIVSTYWNQTSLNNLTIDEVHTVWNGSVYDTHDYNELVPDIDVTSIIVAIDSVFNITVDSIAETLFYNNPFSQEIIRIQVGSCAGDFDQEILNITIYDEQDQDALVPDATIDIAFIINDLGFPTNFTVQCDEVSWCEVCLNNSADFNADVWASYRADDWGAEEKETREHFFIETDFTTDTVYTQQVFKLEDDVAEKIKFTVLDDAGSPFEGYYIQVRRWDGIAYTLVAMARTNAQGEALTYIDYDDTYYQVIVMNSEFEQIYSTSQNIFDSEVEEYTFRISEIAGVTYYSENEHIIYDYSWNNETCIFNSTIYDDRGQDLVVNIEVKEFNGEVICDYTEISASVNFPCEITNCTGGLYYATANAITQAGINTHVFTVTLDETDNFDMAESGLIVAFFIIGGLALSGLAYNPYFIPILAVVGIAITMMLGLIHVEIVLLIGLGVGAIALLMLLKRRE